jgi:hypothetical protein
MSHVAARWIALGLGSAIATTIAYSGKSLWQPRLRDLEWRAAASRQEKAAGAAISEAEARRARVLDHVADSSGSPWAGSYQWSNGYEHYSFDVSPAGFFFKYDNCMGTGDLAYGDVVSVDGSRLRLKFLHRVVREESHLGLEDEIYSIPWGRERFLVPTGRMRELCEMATGSAQCGIRYADLPRKATPGEEFECHHELDVTGLPEMPAEFRDLLHR